VSRTEQVISERALNGTAAGWAEHAGFAEIKELLERSAASKF
jgi:hypothetical protein